MVARGQQTEKKEWSGGKSQGGELKTGKSGQLFFPISLHGSLRRRGACDPRAGRLSHCTLLLSDNAASAAAGKNYNRSP